MNVKEKQRILDCLNEMDIIESQGGEEAYALVENNKENREILEDAGIPLETALGYGDNESFCILSLAFAEGYADLCVGGKLVAFEKNVDVEVAAGEEIIFYKYNNELYIARSEDSGFVSSVKLTSEQVQQIKDLIM